MTSIKYFLQIVVLLMPLISFGQKKDDTKIILTVNDTWGLYEKVKVALVNTDFMVKDNNNKDTLTTYPREVGSFPGFILAKAIITGNKIELTGFYGLKKINDWGYQLSPKNYQNVIYYKGSKTWKILMEVMNKIPGEITYGR